MGLKSFLWKKKHNNVSSLSLAKDLNKQPLVLDFDHMMKVSCLL